MKKKILCLALSALMILASFIGCEEDDREKIMNDIGIESSADAVTLTMLLMSESEVSKEQELLVENAINEITNDYKIRLDLKYYTADKYYTELEKNLKRMKTYYGNKENLNKVTETPVYTDENGLPVTYYPPNEPFQVDIFYFGGYDRYQKYVEEKYFADITETLSGTAASLKGNISSIYYENIKGDKGVYTVMPTNTVVGEYTYMLVNKDVLEKAQYKTTDIVSPTSKNCQELLEMVDVYFKDYVPFYSSEGPLAFDDVKFFGTDSNGFAKDEFSLLSGTFDSSWKKGTENAYPVFDTINNTADNGAGTVKEQIEILKGYEFNGYYATAEEADKPFAVGYIKGGREVLDKYGDDYAITAIADPVLTTEAMYENMLAVAAQSTNVKKSAKIISELYANEEFINLIAHGIEGENYIWRDSNVLDENDNPYRVIEKQVKDPKYTYEIDPNKIGNAAKVYPTVNDDPTRGAKILDQNSDAKLDLLYGFTFYGQGADLSAVAALAEYSAEANKKIIEAKTPEELAAAFEAIDAMLETPEVKAAIADAEKSMKTVYNKWLTANKLIPAEQPAA